MSASDVKWVRLGDYIELVDRYNSPQIYGIDKVRGISNSKEIMPTKADVDETVIEKFYIVKPGEFVYNPRTTRMGEKVGLGYNDTQEDLLFSFNNIAFSICENKKNELLPAYLYLYYKKNEFDRYARINSWGSATELFSWEEMCRVQIPLPDITIQKELVATYNGLKRLAEENEALIEPLQKACQAYVVDCKAKYPMVKLGNYIELYDKRNSDNKIKAVKSVSITKEFKETGAKVNKDELSGYKLVPPWHIAYVQTTKNEKCFANALNTTEETYCVTSVDNVITTKDEKKLDVGYLHILFRQKEFDRYAIFNSWGSAREVFSYGDLCETKIPLPPIEVQKAIVNIYHCLEEAKRISSKAREQLKTLCPALVQRASKK